MNVDKALAKSSIFSKMLDGGNTSRRRVEHRSSLKLSVSNTIPLRFRSDLHYDGL